MHKRNSVSEAEYTLFQTIYGVIIGFSLTELNIFETWGSKLLFYIITLIIAIDFLFYVVPVLCKIPSRIAKMDFYTFTNGANYM